MLLSSLILIIGRPFFFGLGKIDILLYQLWTSYLIRVGSVFKIIRYSKLWYSPSNGGLFNKNIASICSQNTTILSSRIGTSIVIFSSV